MFVTVLPRGMRLSPGVAGGGLPRLSHSYVRITQIHLHLLAVILSLTVCKEEVIPVKDLKKKKLSNTFFI